MQIAKIELTEISNSLEIMIMILIHKLQKMLLKKLTVAFVMKKFWRDSLSNMNVLNKIEKIVNHQFRTIQFLFVRNVMKNLSQRPCLMITRSPISCKKRRKRIDHKEKRRKRVAVCRVFKQDQWFIIQWIIGLHGTPIWVATTEIEFLRVMLEGISTRIIKGEP
jgi:hypothetical protein